MGSHEKWFVELAVVERWAERKIDCVRELGYSEVRLWIWQKWFCSSPE